MTGETATYFPPPRIEVEPPPPEGSATSIEQPMGDQPELVEEVQKEDFNPIPTVEQRRFSAPHTEWDPSRYTNHTTALMQAIC